MNELIVVKDGKALLAHEISVAIAKFETQVTDLKAREDDLKQRILQEMEAHGIMSIETDELLISYVSPTTRETFDSKKFRGDHPEMYDEYVRISGVASSVRVKVKK